MRIEIECEQTLDFLINYYTVECDEKRVYSPCPICEGKNKVEINGKVFDCPECKGGRSKSGLEVIKTIKKYHRTTWRLSRVIVNSFGSELEFEEVKNDGSWGKTETLKRHEIKTLCKVDWGVKRQFYTDRSEVDRRVRELNKAEREKELEEQP